MIFETLTTVTATAVATHPAGTVLDEHGDPVAPAPETSSPATTSPDICED